MVLFVGGEEKHINTTLLHYGCAGGSHCVCSGLSGLAFWCYRYAVLGAGLGLSWRVTHKKKAMVHYLGTAQNLYVWCTLCVLITWATGEIKKKYKVIDQGWKV